MTFIVKRFLVLFWANDVYNGKEFVGNRRRRRRLAGLKEAGQTATFWFRCVGAVVVWVFCGRKSRSAASWLWYGGCRDRIGVEWLGASFLLGPTPAVLIRPRAVTEVRRVSVCAAHRSKPVVDRHSCSGLWCEPKMPERFWWIAQFYYPVWRTISILQE